MGDKRELDIGPLQDAACRILIEEMRDTGVSGRQLAERAGIGTSRAAAILRGVRVVTVDEFDRMCQALGLTTWRVLREASESRIPVHSDALPPEWELAASTPGYSPDAENDQ